MILPKQSKSKQRRKPSSSATSKYPSANSGTTSTGKTTKKTGSKRKY